MIKNKLNLILRYYFTIKYLNFEQIFYRIRKFFPEPRLNVNSVPDFNIPEKRWKSPVKRAIFQPPNYFHLLNIGYKINTCKDWNNHNMSKLFLYNLHYFDYLNSRDKCQPIFIALIHKWIKENPPATGVGWEPYPLSLRIVNWIKWILRGCKFSPEMIKSLAVQTRWLSKNIEYHLSGNHLISNAKALLFAGVFFNDNEAEIWYLKGKRLLLKEIQSQILLDGGHYELSPMYHSIVLEDILDIINLLNLYKIRDKQYKLLPFLASKMVQWLKVMTQPDGKITLFNDSAFCVASDLKHLEYYYNEVNPLHNSAFFANQRSFLELHNGQVKLLHLEKSGYIRIESDNMVILIDVAPIGPDHLPSHGHADSLSFVLSLYGLRVMVDTGVSTYENNSLRMFQKSTFAHNTVIINNINSSEIWGSFRVARRAKPIGLKIEKIKLPRGYGFKILCGHDGYKQLIGGVVHWREWIIGVNYVRITDHVKGNFKNAIVNYYFHPSISVVLNRCRGQECAGKLLLPNKMAVSWNLKGGVCEVVDSFWFPEFNLKIRNKQIKAKFIQRKVVFELSW